MSDGVGSSDSLDGSLVVDRARVCYTLTHILSSNRDRTSWLYKYHLLLPKIARSLFSSRPK